ncbi:MAG: GNAT family N-acetyltransferase, partial [Balneolales bacterium]
KVVDNENSLSSLAESWKKLSEEAKSKIFEKYEWLSSWWKHFGRHPKRQLFIITVYLNNELIGLAPFYIGISSIGPVTVQRRLHLMGCGTNSNEFWGFMDDYGYSDFLDISSLPNHRQIVADSICDFLKHNFMKADTICFKHVNDKSFIVQHLLPSLSKRNITYSKHKTDECPFISLPSSFEEYIRNTGPSSRRRKLKKKLKSASKDYIVENGVTLDEVRGGVEKLIDLHQERWNKIGHSGTFHDKRHLRFVKEFSEIAFRNGWLGLKLAKDEQGCCAVRMVIQDGQAMYDWLSGFNDSASSAKFRPGHGLLTLMIKETIESDINRVELMRGGEKYKFDYTLESSYNNKIIISLNNEKYWVRNLLNHLVHSMAWIHLKVGREIKLLRVQYWRVGFPRFVFGYAYFRLKNIKEKYH